VRFNRIREGTEPLDQQHWMVAAGIEATADGVSGARTTAKQEPITAIPLWQTEECGEGDTKNPTDE
jgi:hypothetical protein